MEKPSIRIDGPSFGWGWIVAFWLFWVCGGWDRVDCALGVKSACELVQSWDERKPVKKPAN